MYIGYIYKITNKINGKSYIGKTNNLIRRWNEHKSGKGGTAILSKAFIKYGINNFLFEKLIRIQSKKIDKLNCILSALEKYYIRKLNTFHDGYNATIGGDGTSNYHHSDITKKKISLANRGKKLTEKQRLNCGNAFKGKHHTIEACNKIRQACLNRPKSVYEIVGCKLRGRKRDRGMIMKAALKRRKPIIQYDINGNYLNEYSSALLTGFSESNIIACCRGKIGSAYGYIWRYKESPIPIDTSRKVHVCNKAVIQYTLEGNPVEIFNSATEASKITSIGRKAIVNCLTKRSKSAGGYLWIYKDGRNV